MKKKKKEKDIFRKQVFSMEAEPYDQHCIVVLNGKFEDAYKYLKRVKAKKSIIDAIEKDKEEYFNEGNYLGYVCPKLPVGFVMIIKVQSNWIETVKIVAHESMHLTYHIHRRTGMTLSTDSEEAYTYLMEKMIEKILRKIY